MSSGGHRRGRSTAPMRPGPARPAGARSSRSRRSDRASRSPSGQRLWSKGAAGVAPIQAPAVSAMASGSLVRGTGSIPPGPRLALASQAQPVAAALRARRSPPGRAPSPERPVPRRACPWAAPRRTAHVVPPPRQVAWVAQPEVAAQRCRWSRADHSSQRPGGRGPRRGRVAAAPAASRSATRRRERRLRRQRHRGPGPRG